MKSTTKYSILAIAIVGIGSGIYLSSSSKPTPEPATTTPVTIEKVTPKVEPEATPIDTIQPAQEEGVAATPEPAHEKPALAESPLSKIPALNESDEPFSQSIGEVLDQTAAPQWLTQVQVLRKSVAMTASLADGTLNFKNRPIKYSALPGTFTATNDGSRLLLDKANFTRYDGAVKLLTSIDNDKLVSTYEYWRPRLQEAYSELGIDGTIDEVLIKAIDNLLAAPRVEGSIQLIRPSVYYKYADPALEQLNGAQKLMIRMGSENADQIKQKLTSLRAALIKQSINQ